MKFLSNLSVRNKLILLAILPFSVVLYFLQKTIAIQWKHQEINAQTAQDLEAIEKITNLIHNLQNEQSFATILTTSKQDDKTEILRLQEQTNQSLAGLEQFFYHAQLSNKRIDSLLAAVKQRDPLQTTDKDQLSLALLNEISQVWRYASNMTIKNQQECTLFMLYAQEFLSMVRNDLYRAIHQQGFQKNGYGIFAANKGKFDINLHKFRNHTTPGLLEYFENTYTRNPAVIHMQANIDSAFALGSMTAITPDKWQQQTTAAIDALHACNLRAFDIMRTGIQTEAEDISAAYFRNILLSGIVIILIIISILSIKEIANSVNRMKEATERITNGDIDFTLDITSRDEMGQLARSFNHMITVFKGYVQLAESIGKGNYQTDVVIRSNQDSLGKALVNMKTNLLRLSQEKETRN
jgi:HAMP domain-containing protein